jgi:hypothetical protein
MHRAASTFSKMGGYTFARSSSVMRVRNRQFHSVICGSSPTFAA